MAFIDLGDDPERPAYAVASDALQFLAFLFEKELGNPAWPFNAAEVFARDPKLADLLGELPAPGKPVSGSRDGVFAPRPAVREVTPSRGAVRARAAPDERRGGARVTFDCTFDCTIGRQ